MLKNFLIVTLLCLAAAPTYAGKEYDACYEKAADDGAVAACMKEETARLMKQIQDDYILISQNAQTKDWNKGNGLISGNLKDMYNSWLAYRNRYCSLYRMANKHMYGSQDYHYENCMVQMTDDHLKLLESVLLSANGSMDDPNEEY